MAKISSAQFVKLIQDSKLLGINFNKVEEIQTPQGIAYYVEGSGCGGTGAFYVPANLSNVRAVVTGYPGSGATAQTSASGVPSYKHLLEQIKGGKTPDYIVAISPNMGNQGNTF